MASGPRYSVPFRRRREGRTDYRSRRELLRSRLPRLVVRLSNRNTIVQVIEYRPEGDHVLASATTLELAGLGWDKPTGNLPGAYLAGLLAGTRAQGRLPDGAILDLGLLPPVPGSKVFAALKGVLDAGVKVPHGTEVLPPDERLRGTHVGPGIPELVQKVATTISGGKVTVGGSPKGAGKKPAPKAPDGPAAPSLEEQLSKRKTKS